jgi:Ca-activated chloride channel family protein
VKEFGGTLFTIAKDVKFQIEFNPSKVGSYRLIGYENRMLNEEDFNDDKKDAGEMGSGHCVTALYELIPAGLEEKFPSVDPLKYQQRDNSPKGGNGFEGEYLNIKIRYKKPDGVTSMLFEKPVKDYVNNPEDASDNLKFAAAVAEFGMILRNSEFRGNSTLESAIGLAGSARGSDTEGYRAEMVRLMKTAKGLGVTADRDMDR